VHKIRVSNGGRNPRGRFHMRLFIEANMLRGQYTMQVGHCSRLGLVRGRVHFATAVGHRKLGCSYDSYILTGTRNKK
jgi:hypothetical protein